MPLPYIFNDMGYLPHRRGETPLSLADLFRQSGAFERQYMGESQQQNEERLRQLKIQQLLDIFKMYGEGGFNKEEVDRSINNTRGIWM
jgi:hypothetical protein